MKKLLYIGNALSKQGKTSTSIETLGLQLDELYSVKIASNKSNKLLRLLDMMRLVLINRLQTDYVLIDTYSTVNFYYDLVISQLCRVLNLKYIPILHGGNLEHRLKDSPRLSRLIFKNAYRLVAPSHFLKSVFESYGYKEIEHIPNSIVLEDYAFENRAIDRINLLWVRSFSALYNPELAVLVLEQLLEMNYEAELTMVGPEADGSLARAKALAKRKNLDVNFTGQLTKLEWLALSKHSNVFINTTNFDNTPVSVIEAMALGLPVVSTNVGGLPFLISDTIDGLLVAPESVGAMANAIIELKTDEALRTKLVINARAKVENFSWETVRHQWTRLLS